MPTVRGMDQDSAIDMGPSDQRGIATVQRTMSDVCRPSQYRATASLELRRSSDAPISLNDKAAQKAFHTARLKSTIDFFRKKEEFNKTNSGTNASRGRPLSIHASFSYGNHSNHPNAGSLHRNDLTSLPKFAGDIVQRSSEPNLCQVQWRVDSSDDKTARERGSSARRVSMDDVRRTTSCKPESHLNCVKTGVEPAATVGGQADNDLVGGLPTLEKLKQDIEMYDKELHQCEDYDRRRAYRAKIRDLRKQIKEEKYCKPEASGSFHVEEQQTSSTSTLPQTSLSAAVPSSKEASRAREHPTIVEESASPNHRHLTNSVSRSAESSHRKRPTNTRGQHATDTKDKDVRPEITKHLADQTSVDGDPCSFTCNILAPDGATITWYHDDRLLPPSDDIKQSFAGGTATLDITEVFPDDEGVYKCVVSCPAGKAETAARLTVLGENDLEMPDISVPLENQTCSEGDTIVLKCMVCGKPEPSITWSRDGYPLLGAKRYVYSYDGREATLTIHNAITGDEGSYACEARNAAGMASCECIIDVKASPSKRPEFLAVLPSSHLVSEGHMLTLVCYVAGRPHPHVTWYHKSKLLSEDDKHDIQEEGDCVKLILHNVTPDMAGQYTCLARNSSGDIRCITDIRVTSTGKTRDKEKSIGKDKPVASSKTVEPGKPVFVTPLRDVSVPDGAGSFVLRCQIRARPRPVVLWQKGRDFIRSGSRYKEGFDGEVATLEIRSVNKGDTDTYTCMCRNEFGKVKCSCNLTVQDPHATLSAAKMSDKPDISSINDEDELYKLMNGTDDFEERKKIRARIREIRDAKAGSDILKKAEEEAQKKLKELNEEGVSRTTKTEKSSDGGTTVTSTTVTTHKTKDGSATTIKQTKQVTQTSGLGGTSYSITKTSAASKPTGPRGARAAFQQMDKATAPPGGAKPNFLGGGGGGRVTVQRSPSTIKQMLLDWCKSVTKEYEPKISITNFSSSWNNGLAFCALIHHFYPDAFNFDELDPKNRRHNFTLAFDTAEKMADIAPLLDVEDMVRMKNPDWKCVFTYVQSFYRRFRNSPSTPTTPVTPISPEPQAD